MRCMFDWIALHWNVIAGIGSGIMVVSSVFAKLWKWRREKHLKTLAEAMIIGVDYLKQGAGTRNITFDEITLRRILGIHQDMVYAV